MFVHFSLPTILVPGARMITVGAQRKSNVYRAKKEPGNYNNLFPLTFDVNVKQQDGKM